MNARVGIIAAAILSVTVSSSAPVRAQAFTGDVRYACEAILCLAAPNRPRECAAAVKKYFSISATKFKDTLKKRKNFLALCPKTDIDLDKIVSNAAPEWSDKPTLLPPKIPLLHLQRNRKFPKATPHP